MGKYSAVLGERNNLIEHRQRRPLHVLQCQQTALFRGTRAFHGQRMGNNIMVGQIGCGIHGGGKGKAGKSEGEGVVLGVVAVFHLYIWVMEKN